MQNSSPEYRPKNFFPLRDYSDFYSPKREIAGEVMQIERVEKIIKKFYWNEQDFDFFHQNEGLSEEKSRANQLSAALFRFLALNNTKTKIKVLALQGVETAQQLAELVQKSTIYGVKKLKIKTLLAKAKAFFKANFSLSFLCHKNRGNAHAAKAWTQDAKDALLGLYAAPGSDVQLLESQVWREYNKLAIGERQFVNEITGELINNETRKLPVIKSKTTVWNLFQNPLIRRITAKLRHGDKYYNDNFLPYLKGVKPNHSLSFVSSDGQHVPFRLRVNGTDTYSRAVCYFVFDVKTGAIIGHSIAQRETKELMSEAFADMLVNTKGVRPYEVQLDNFGKSFKKELELIFPEVSFCKPLSPQSKFAERYIAHFEQQYCRKQSGWLGVNMAAMAKDNSGRRNPDIKLQSYSLTEIKAMYARMIAEYNREIVKNTSGQTRWEVLEQTINPGCDKIEETTLASLFGKTTLASIQRGYVKIEIAKKEYYYSVPDYTEIGAKLKNGKKVRVRYLPHKLSEKIWLYNFDKHDRQNLKADTYLTTALAVEGVQRAKAEQSHEGLKTLGKASRWVDETSKADELQANEIPALVDPEVVLSMGYTEKDLMQQAEESTIQKVDSEKVDSKKKKKTKGKKGGFNRWNSWE